MTALSAARSSRPDSPLALDLVNLRGESIVYIHEGIQPLWLSIQNDGVSDLRPAPLGVQQAAPDAFHFQLHFRPGILHGDSWSSAATALKSLGWDMHLDRGAGDGDRLSLLWLGTPTAAAGTGLLGAGSRMLLPLSDFRVEEGAGSRTTRVLVRYSGLQGVDGGPTLSGQRVELLNILYRAAGRSPQLEEQRLDAVEEALQKGDMPAAVERLQTNAQAWMARFGMTALPLEVGWEDWDTLLNDGSANTLKLAIENPHPEPILLGPPAPQDEVDDREPKLIVELPEVLRADDTTGVEATVTSSLQRHWTVTGRDPWVLTPPSGARWEGGERLVLELTGLKTSAPSGVVRVTVRYEDVYRSGEGTFEVPLWLAHRRVERHGDHDMVVVRRGGNIGREPGGCEESDRLALYVEATDGRAATFRDVQIEQTDGAALQVHGTTELGLLSARSQTGHFTDTVRIVGRSPSAPSLHVEATTRAEVPALSVVQDGPWPKATFKGGKGVCIDGGALEIDGPSCSGSINKIYMYSLKTWGPAQIGGSVEIRASGSGEALGVSGGASFTGPGKVVIRRNAPPTPPPTPSDVPALRVDGLPAKGAQALLEVGYRSASSSQAIGSFKDASHVVAKVHGGMKAGVRKTLSDLRLKENVEPIPDPLQRLLALRGVSFTWRGDPSGQPDLGFIAQEVAEVFPSLVSRTGDYLSISTDDLIPVSLEALRALHQQCLAQERQLQRLQQRLAALEPQDPKVHHG